MKNKMMLIQTRTFSRALFAVMFCMLVSCYTEDPGPIQEVQRQFSVRNFDRLEIGDAFRITVQEGSYFEVEAEGDRRNIDDLSVKVEGSTLVIKYNSSRNRRHDTSLRITMPQLRSATFSGASDSRIAGFSDQEQLDISLSGASMGQFNGNASNVRLNLSGASNMFLYGHGEALTATVSGASLLNSLNFPVAEVTADVSGASTVRAEVIQLLTANVSGASVVVYEGDPVVEAEVSGESTLRPL